MADFNCPEMAAVVDGRRFSGGAKGGWEATGGRWRRTTTAGRTGYRSLALACALALTIGSILMSAVCLWSQRQLEAENWMLREDVEDLESKISTVEETLSEGFGRSNAEPSSAGDQPWPQHSGHGRMRRSPDRKQRKSSKAVHYRLDGGDGSTTTQLKWRIGNGVEASDRLHSQFLLEAARLTDDRKGVVITESGLYFIYAQISFENAMRRNAFAVKVDDAIITKCFQSLDYFNQSLGSTENSRLKTCYSSSIVVLRRNQVVSLANLYPAQRILNDPYANYWGIVKFADA